MLRMRQICTIRKMEKKSDDAKAIQKDYKFEIALFKSLQYAKKEDDKKTDDADTEEADVQLDDEAEADDDKYHSNATNKATIYVVRCRRILGDDLQFRKLQKKVYLDGQQIFNGLPEWAMNMETQDVFDDLLKNYENPKNGATAKYEIKDDEYDNVNWDEDVQVAAN